MPNPYLSNYAVIGAQGDLPPAFFAPTQQFTPTAAQNSNNSNSGQSGSGNGEILASFLRSSPLLKQTQSPAPVFDATPRTV